jgi:cytochrome d ubiquinol oxidase subunit II
MNSIAPVWDGNETWLVLGGGGLLAAFPLAYAVIMSALYAPLVAMLLGLVFRGVAFEFRWRDPAHRAFWDLAFTGGSFVAALMQGVMLGALLQGVHVEGRGYAGGWWDWLTAFSLLTGVALLVGFRPSASMWGRFAVAGIVAAFAVALAWASAALGLSAKTVAGANGSTLPIQFLLPFLSSAFVPAASMPEGVRWFSAQQPFTPVVESLRALLTGVPAGRTTLLALLWCAAIALAGHVWAGIGFRRRTR